MDETTNAATSSTLTLRVLPISKPEDINLILGQAHFIKTVEDLHEALVGAVPGIRFGLAFCEASGPALVRWSGTDDELTALARDTMLELGTGHAFLILLREAFPINVLAAVRVVPPLYVWKIRSRVYRWYGQLRTVEQADRKSVV